MLKVLRLILTLHFSIMFLSLGFQNIKTFRNSVRPHSLLVRYLKVEIHAVGKKGGSEDWIADGINEYEKRLRPSASVNTHFYKTDEDLVQAFTQKSMKGSILALDENGKQFTSRQFADVVSKSFVEGGATISFIIGGFAGLPDNIRSSCQLISLSKMTWTHQMARLLLVEQVYRAFEIQKNSRYHKD